MHYKYFKMYGYLSCMLVLSAPDTEHMQSMHKGTPPRYVVIE